MTLTLSGLKQKCIDAWNNFVESVPESIDMPSLTDTQRLAAMMIIIGVLFLLLALRLTYLMVFQAEELVQKYTEWWTRLPNLFPLWA